MHYNLYFPVQVILVCHLGFSTADEKCGGLVQGRSGGISYKTRAFADTNERCAWIVRAPNSTAYNITIQSLGPPSSLVISAISDYSEEHVVPTTLGDILLNRTLAFVVTFATGSANLANKTRGFSLSYIGNNELVYISNFSIDAVLSADFGHLKYDIRTNHSAEYELSIFVVTPVRGFGGAFKKMEISITTRRFYIDKFSIYMFNEHGIGSNKWENTGLYFGSEYEKISTSDVILMVFRSYQGPPVAPGSRRFHLVSNTLTC